MNERTRQRLRWIRTYVWVNPISWLDRGQGLWNRFTALFILSAAAMVYIEWWNENIGWFSIKESDIIKIAIGIVVFWVVTGYLDQEHLHLTQAEQERVGMKLDPIRRETLQGINKILRYFNIK